MVFSSILFLLLFLPMFFIGYSLIPKKIKNFWILLGSIVFYAWGAPRFIFILIGSTIIDYYLVAQMDREKSGNRKRLLLSFSIILNLGLLLYFKYANFFIENINLVLGFVGSSAVQWTKVILPIGISFYTFQTLTYSIDIYRGINKPLKKISDYLLYILSFPQMIAGPIVRFSAVKKDIQDRDENIDNKLVGITRFSIGLAKKVFIANILGEQADLIFDTDYEILTSMEAWIGILAYTFQIYFDFSGYSDMAIGLGRMMGFSFPENFNSPYISKSITEFWRRWHITLSEWMRDYLYISLGGNKVNSKFRLYSNLITVFVISGLWHGASWNFILWGSLHGIFLIMDRLFLKSFLDKLGPIFSIPITFFLAMMGWVVFRIEEFDHALDFYSILFSFEGGFLSLSREVLFTFLLAFIASFMTIIPFVNRYKNKFVNQRKIHNWRSFLLLIIALIALFLSIIKVSSSDFNPFIYFRF